MRSGHLIEADSAFHAARMPDLCSRLTTIEPEPPRIAAATRAGSVHQLERRARVSRRERWAVIGFASGPARW